MKQQQGFTLIELIVVIVILGILAATALPKFTALQVDARIAKLNAARGAVLAAASIVHSTYLARAGVADAAACPGGGIAATNTLNGTVCTESGTVQLTNGYPSATIALGAALPGGIVGAAGISPAFFSPSLVQLNAEGYGALVGATTRIDVIGGAATAGGLNATCSFIYNPAVLGAAPVVGAVVTGGC